MNALLSIKPEFGNKILDGEKQYEFRKTVFSEPSAVEKVILYASSPVQRIIGYFSFCDIIEDSPEELWRRFSGQSGIESRERFMEYFQGNRSGYAIEIEDAVPLRSPINPREHLEEFRAPMSFSYVNGEFDPVIDGPEHSAPQT